MSLMSMSENWLKGSQGLTIIKNALIPSLEEHFTASSKKWETGDNHIKHLFNLASQKEVKRTKKDNQIWTVDCDGCKPILEDLAKCHRRPEKLAWMNNADQTLILTDETRLAKVFMCGGNAGCQSLNDRDSLAILEVCRNNVRLGLVESTYHLLDYLILFRNRIMHSNDNCIKEDEKTQAFTKMKELLKCNQLKDRTECIEAVEELNKLENKDMLSEIDESNPIWKEAISIQKIAIEQVGSKPPITQEAMEQLLKNIKDEMEKEKNQRKSMESKLQHTERELNETNRNLQTSRLREQNERSRAESTKLDLERMESIYNQQEGRLHEDEYKLQADAKEIDRLRKEVEELQAHSPTFAGRVAKGTVTGTGVGVVGGPLTAAVGGVAGGAVGGLSYFWDKITGK